MLKSSFRIFKFVSVLTSISRYLAQWIRSGYPPYDLTECDPGRYGSWSDDPRYILEKTRETYGMNNAYGYVKEERQAGRPSKRAGHFYSVLEERGAQFGFKAGFEVIDGYVRLYKSWHVFQSSIVPLFTALLFACSAGACP